MTLGKTVTEKFSSWLSSFQVSDVSTRMREVAILDLVDAAGLCVAAAPEVYARQLIIGIMTVFALQLAI